MRTRASLIFEQNFRSTTRQKIGKILCLVIPVASAFGGYFAAGPLWKLIMKNADGQTSAPEGFKFALSLAVFAITVIIVFFKTRNTNPIMKIRVLSEKSENQDESKA